MEIVLPLVVVLWVISALCAVWMGSASQHEDTPVAFSVAMVSLITMILTLLGGVVAQAIGNAMEISSELVVPYTAFAGTILSGVLLVLWARNERDVINGQPTLFRFGGGFVAVIGIVLIVALKFGVIGQ